MFFKIVRNLLIALLSLFVLFEIVCWAFVRYPVNSLYKLDLENDLSGFKKKVRIIYDRDQVRYLDWTGGEKDAGTVRILCIGGWATTGMLQAAEDTWWGRLHGGLKAQGLKVETAARGFERIGIIPMAAASKPLIERLKPDVLILNAGYDDVIIHSAEFVYDKDKLTKMPVQEKPSAMKQFIIKYSQTARFRRWWSDDSDAKKRQNELGRSNAYKKLLDEKMAAMAQIKMFEGILRRGSAQDPLPEYLDGLAAFRDMAAAAGAKLILTGEASLHNSAFMNKDHLTSLLAYVPLTNPDASGRYPAARPNPSWVREELERFAGAASDFATKNSLPWVDLNGIVDRTTENFFTDVMLTDTGAAAAAEALLPVVLPVVKSAAK